MWRGAAAAYGEVTSDVLGSSYVRVAGGEGSTLAVLGHIDEIGLIVTHIHDQGFLAVRRIGGFNAELLVGQRVTLMTRGGEIRAVVARRKAKAHGEEKAAAVEIDDLDVDIGARDADEARSLVRPGDANGAQRRALRVAEPKPRLARVGQSSGLVRRARGRAPRGRAHAPARRRSGGRPHAGGDRGLRGPSRA